MTLRTETRYAIDPATAKSLDTDALRSHFHKDGPFAEGEINLVHTHCDRFILGSAVPGAGTLTLDHVS
jgi:4-deoxy-L-threo-5-hexosulose-uronate ketol-isomerase